MGFSGCSSTIEAVGGVREEHLYAFGHNCPLRGIRVSRHDIACPGTAALDRHAALSHMAPMIIAIDGPAASGKGTLGKRLAHHYGYRHLDTGVIYRAVAKALLDEGFDLTDEARAVAVAMALDPESFGHPELKTQKIGDAARAPKRARRPANGLKEVFEAIDEGEYRSAGCIDDAGAA